MTRAIHTHSFGYAVLTVLPTFRKDVDTTTPPHRCMKLQGRFLLHGTTWRGLIQTRAPEELLPRATSPILEN